MTGPSTQSQVTLYLVFLVFVVTLGPLQFGYHLVRIHYALPIRARTRTRTRARYRSSH